MKPIRIISYALLAIALVGCSPDEQLPGPLLPRPEIPVTEVSASESVGVEAEETPPIKPSPFYNSYSMNLEINPAQRKVMATEKISYKNQTGRELDKIYVRFNINAFSEGYLPQPFFDEFRSKVYKYGTSYSSFTLNTITVNSEKVGYEINGRNIGVLLENKLPPESNIDITMQFECTIPAISHKIGANADALWFGNFIPVVATYLDGEFVLDQYYPAGEPFVYETSNFDITVTTPPDYAVIGTGIENVVENETNRITKFSINVVRDFAFAISNKYKTDSRTSEAGIKINFHHYSDNPLKVNMLLDAAAMSADYLNDRAGAYPYQEIDICETELPIEGANAFPCVVFVDSDYFNKSSGYDAIGLEICRQWFYNVVGNNQIKEAWLGTGLSSYLQTRINFRSETVDMRMKALHADLSNKLPNAQNYSLLGHLSGYSTWEEYYGVHYSRASLMFHALYRKMGQEKWNEFLKAYYNENSFKIAERQNLVDCASNVYGERLDDFFESWLTWRELPNLP